MDHNSLAIGRLLHPVSLDHLQQHFVTENKVQPQLAGAHGCLSARGFSIICHALGEYRPNRDLATPKFFPRAIKLWHIISALLHSPEGRIKRRQRFTLMDSGDMVTLLPCLIVYTRREDTRPPDASQKASDGRAPLACRPVAGANAAARTLPEILHSAGNEGAWITLVVKFLL